MYMDVQTNLQLRSVPNHLHLIIDEKKESNLEIYSGYQFIQSVIRNVFITYFNTVLVHISESLAQMLEVLIHTPNPVLRIPSRIIKTRSWERQKIGFSNGLYWV